MVALPIRLLGTFLYALVVGLFAFYIWWSEGWAQDLAAYRKKK